MTLLPVLVVLLVVLQTQAECPPGTFSRSPNECLPCPRGTFSDLPDTVHCSVCGPGMVAPEEGLSACEPCPANTRAVSSTVCVPCPPGHYSNVSAGVCFPCSPGSHFHIDGCVPCLPGTEAPYAGMECQECESGTFAPTPGTIKCVDCEQGFITKPGQTIVCQPCPTGLNTRWPGDDRCQDTVLSSDQVPDGNTVMTICFVFIAFFVAIAVIIFAFSKCQ